MALLEQENFNGESGPVLIENRVTSLNGNSWNEINAHQIDVNDLTADKATSEGTSGTKFPYAEIVLDPGSTDYIWQGKCLANNITNTSTFCAVTARIVSQGDGISAGLFGGADGARGVALAKGLTKQGTDYLFDWAINTEYGIRLVVRDSSTPNEIDCEVWVDEGSGYVKRITETITDSTIYGNNGRVGIRAVLNGTGDAGWDDLELNDFKLSVQGSSSSSGALSLQKNITKTLSGLSSNAGAVSLNVQSVIQKALSGLSTNVGVLLRTTSKQISLSGSSSNTGALARKSTMSLSGSSNNSGSVSLKVVNLFKFATHYATPAQATLFPISFLEIGDLSSAPASEPTGGRYLPSIQKHPELDVETTETLFGIRTFNDMVVELSNKGELVSSASELRDLDARLFRQVGGAFTKIFTGKVAGFEYGRQIKLRLKDKVRDALETIFPKLVITATDYPEARDVGARQPIIVGRNSRVGPLPYIEHDELNDVYRYSAGVGKGYNNGNFKEITTAYRGEVAFKTVTGTVLLGVSNGVRLESNDSAPKDFYKDQWITINSQTPKLIDTSDQTPDCFLASGDTFDITPQNGDTYTIRPFRFYDGSQVSPFPGFAILEFAFPIEDGSSFEPIYIDCDGLQEERNLIRFIQSLLSDPTWGAGLTLNTSDFDTQAVLTEITAMLIEGKILNEEKLFDILSELFSYRNIDLFETESGISIQVETLRASPDAYFGLGDKKKENIKKGTLGNVNNIDTEEASKSLTAHYRHDDYLGDYIQKELKRDANSFGVDREIILNYVYAHETADRILDFKRKFEISKAKEWEFQGKREALLKKNYRINADMQLDGMAFNSDWRIRDLVDDKNYFQLFLNPYPADAFTYEAGSLPPNESFPVPAKLEATPPNPLANVVLSYIKDFDGSGILQTFALFDYDIPEQNFFEARVIIRKSGDTAWQSGGSSTGEQVRVPITPGITYDYQIAPYNPNGIPGLAETFSSQLAPGDTTDPKPPTNLIGKGGLENMSWEWDPVTQNVDNSTIEDLKGYEYRIYTASSGGTQVYPKAAGGAYAFTPDTQVNINDLEGDLTAIKRTLWLEVRAIDNTGNTSTTTSRVSAGTREILQPDILDGEIIQVSSANSPSEVELGSNQTIISTTITPKGSKVEIIASCSVRNNSLSPSGGGATIELRRNSTVLRTKTNVHQGLTQNETTDWDINFVDTSPGSSSNTYEIRTAPSDQMFFKNRYIYVADRKR